MPRTDKEEQKLLSLTPKRWNSKEKYWEMDSGYVEAVHREDDSHTSRKRYSRDAGEWVLRKNKTAGYIQEWTKMHRDIPRKYQPKGRIDDKTFIKYWAKADELDDMRKVFFWKSDKELKSQMLKISNYLTEK